MVRRDSGSRNSTKSIIAGKMEMSSIKWRNWRFCSLIHRRGRVSCPGGNMSNLRICIGESVIVRFRDGRPVPYRGDTYSLSGERADFRPHPLGDASGSQGNLPRPKNVPPAHFLNGLSIPVRQIKNHTKRCGFLFGETADAMSELWSINSISSVVGISIGSSV